MAYSQGGLIEAVDYNNFLNGSNQLNTVWSTGSGATGYGQSALSTVSVGNLVTATQWATLINALNNITAHQTGSTTAIAAVSAGAQIDYLSSLQTAINNAYTNRALYASNGATTTGSDFTTAVNTGSGVDAYIDRFVTFASADAARYFFNAGGYLRLVVSYNSGNGSGSTDSLQRLIDQNSGVYIYNTTNSGRQGTGGTVNTENTNIGYRNTNYSAETMITRVYDTTGSYSASYSEVITYTNSNDTTNGANGTQLNFRYRYIVADKVWDDDISLNIVTRVDIIYPETTYLTDVWGTPTVA